MPLGRRPLLLYHYIIASCCIAAHAASSFPLPSDDRDWPLSLFFASLPGLDAHRDENQPVPESSQGTTNTDGKKEWVRPRPRRIDKGSDTVGRWRHPDREQSEEEEQRHEDILAEREGGPPRRVEMGSRRRIFRRNDKGLVGRVGCGEVSGRVKFIAVVRLIHAGHDSVV